MVATGIAPGVACADGETVMAKILIVEDDEILASSLEILLQHAGHECRTLRNGVDVLETARVFKPDLLLLDIMLPNGVCGFEVCRRIRRDPELYTLPILALSAMSHEEEVAHGLAQGADDFVTKPFENQNLLRRIDMLLEIHASSEGIDSLTGLPSPDIIRHEVQRRVSGREKFAMVCAELTGLRELSRTYGNEARSRVIRHFARILQHSGEKMESAGVFVGHMGGGYFICLLEVGAVATFCKLVQRYWQEASKKLFGDGTTPGEFYKGGQVADLNVPRVLLCATATEGAASDSVKGLFETLTQLRTKALSSNVTGYFLDQRCGGLGATSSGESSRRTPSL